MLLINKVRGKGNTYVWVRRDEDVFVYYETINREVNKKLIYDRWERRLKSPPISAQPLFHCSLEMKKLV